MEIIDGISLTNDGQLDLGFIGVGGAFALENFQTNLLITKGNAHIMVDAGQKAQLALASVGLSPLDIRVVLPTHSHADHIGGLETLALMNRFIGLRSLGLPKIKIIVTERYEHILWDHSLRGGLENNEICGEECGLELADYFEILRPNLITEQPRRTFEIDCGGIHLEMFRTIHFPGQAHCLEEAFLSYGLLIDNKVFFSSDTQFDPDLVEAYRDRAEVFFHDVQFFEGGVHASLSQLMTLDEQVRKRMYLTHYADNHREYDLSGFAGLAKQGITYRFD